MQDFRSEALLLAQEAQQEVLGAYVLVAQPLGLFSAVSQYSLAFVAERQIDGRRYLFANRRVPLDLFPDRIDRGVRTQEPVRQLLVFPQQPQQQVLGFDVWASKLARL